MSTLREALARRTSLRTWWDVPIVPAEQVERAQRELDQVRQTKVAVLLAGDPATRARLDQAEADAEAAVRACFHRTWFAGLSENDFDALVDLHPPTDDDVAQGRAWHPPGFTPALLAACAQDDDGASAGLTVEEWADQLASDDLPAPERRHVVTMVFAAQRQTMADAVPKG